MSLDVSENSTDADEYANVASHDEWTEEDFTEVLAQEGDDDAVYVMDFETAAADVLQGDEELASAYTTYVDARRKLSEKFRARGFWPVGKGKKGFSKGKFKSKTGWNGSRKSLQQRILESNCRMWKERALEIRVPTEISVQFQWFKLSSRDLVPGRKLHRCRRCHANGVHELARDSRRAVKGPIIRCL